MRYTDILKLKKLEMTDSPPDITELNDNWDIIEAFLKAHVDDTSNPHSVTADQAGAISKTLSTFNNANDVKTTGFYKAESSAKNIPPDTNQGLMLVLDVRGVSNFGNVYQVFIAPYTLYIRYWSWSVQGNDWSSWRKTFNDNNIVPVTAGGTGAVTEAQARKNLKTDMILIDGYSSLGLSGSDFGATSNDFVSNIEKIVDKIDSDDNFMVQIHELDGLSNFTKCISNKIRGALHASFTNAYFSIYIYGRKNNDFPIIVDIAISNKYLIKYIISSKVSGTRTVSNGICLFHGTNSNIWGSFNKPFFSYSGDGSTTKRDISCGNANGYLESRALLITSQNHIGFATGNGGLFFDLSDGTSTTFTRDEVFLDDQIGNLKIKTDNDAVNKSGTTYTCSAL